LPDAPGLELIRGEIERDRPGAVLATSFDRAQAALIVDPAQIIDVLRWLREEPGQRYDFLSSLHVADYLPAEPRFGIHYELLNRDRVERIRVKAMLADPVGADEPSAESAAGQGAPGQSPRTDALARPQDSAPALPPGAGALPEIDSCVSLFPTANFQEREAFDFFGIIFRGHPDLTRILLPDDYVGWPQRRDFPVGGEPVTFTYNERRYG
jgi:NADH-quinone oxidoreductase subunit C